MQTCTSVRGISGLDNNSAQCWVYLTEVLRDVVESLSQVIQVKEGLVSLPICMPSGAPVNGQLVAELALHTTNQPDGTEWGMSREDLASNVPN